MRGENRWRQWIPFSVKGLSPHARGKRLEIIGSVGISGTIPACAGKTWSFASMYLAPWDYPRMRGENRLCLGTTYTKWGLSPHARGKLSGLHHSLNGKGTIPACAGKTATPSATLPTLGDYPRMRGENGNLCIRVGNQWGLSPHARGKPAPYKVAADARGTIPACAGKTWLMYRKTLCAGDYPRMRGENIIVTFIPRIPAGLSPHARGKRRCWLLALSLRGTIPACAGKTIAS